MPSIESIALELNAGTISPSEALRSLQSELNTRYSRFDTIHQDIMLESTRQSLLDNLNYAQLNILNLILLNDSVPISEKILACNTASKSFMIRYYVSRDESNLEYAVSSMGLFRIIFV